MKNKWTIIAVLSLVAVVLLVRRPEAILQPQFNAEDGSVFFAQQRDLGAWAVVEPFAGAGHSGYLHLIPRLIALSAAVFLPASAAPAFYNCAALLITLAAAACVFSPRFPVGHKPLLAVAIVLMPNSTCDVLLLTPTNLQWLIVAPLFLVVLFKEAPHEKYGNLIAQWAGDLTILVLCGLTGPFAVIFLPFYAWQALKERTRYRSAMFLAILAAASVQLYFLATTDASRWAKWSPWTPANALIRPITGREYCQIFGDKILVGLFVGATVSDEVGNFAQLFSCPRGVFCYLFAVLYIAWVGFLLRLSWHNRFALVCLMMHFIFVTAAISREAYPVWLVSAYWDGRYFFVPYLMLAWCIIALLDQQEKWKRVVLRTAIGMILLSTLTTLFHGKSTLDFLSNEPFRW